MTRVSPDPVAGAVPSGWLSVHTALLIDVRAVSLAEPKRRSAAMLVGRTRYYLARTSDRMGPRAAFEGSGGVRERMTTCRSSGENIGRSWIEGIPQDREVRYAAAGWSSGKRSRPSQFGAPDKGGSASIMTLFRRSLEILTMPSAACTSPSHLGVLRGRGLEWLMINEASVGRYVPSLTFERPHRHAGTRSMPLSRAISFIDVFSSGPHRPPRPALVLSASPALAQRPSRTAAAAIGTSSNE